MGAGKVAPPATKFFANKFDENNKEITIDVNILYTKFSPVKVLFMCIRLS